MLYSVMNTKSRQYDYYETGEAESSWHAPPAPRARAATALGAVPEDAAWPLPSGARRVGSGEMARGRIATRRGTPIGMPGLGAIEPALEVAATAAAMIAGLALLVKIGGSR
jgi:hypothetical protein